MEKEKKGIRISLSRLIFIILIILIIIAILGWFVFKLSTDKIAKIQNEIPDTADQEDETNTNDSTNKKTISGRFAQNKPEYNGNYWFDAGEFLFKEDGTVENSNSASKNGYYTINGNIISVHFTDVEGEPIEENMEFIIKDDDTLLSLSYDTEKDNPICYVSGTVFYRQKDNDTAESNSKSNEEDVDISNKKERGRIKF